MNQESTIGPTDATLPHCHSTVNDVSRRGSSSTLATEANPYYVIHVTHDKISLINFLF